MIKLALRLSAAVLPLLALAAAPAPQPVTPMTPDVVAKYERSGRRPTSSGAR